VNRRPLEVKVEADHVELMLRSPRCLVVIELSSIMTGPTAVPDGAAWWDRQTSKRWHAEGAGRQGGP